MTHSTQTSVPEYSVRCFRVWTYNWFLLRELDPLKSPGLCPPRRHSVTKFTFSHSNGRQKKVLFLHKESHNRSLLGGSASRCRGSSLILLLVLPEGWFRCTSLLRGLLADLKVVVTFRVRFTLESFLGHCKTVQGFSWPAFYFQNSISMRFSLTFRIFKNTNINSQFQSVLNCSIYSNAIKGNVSTSGLNWKFRNKTLLLR